MKNLTKLFSILLIALALLNTSCREEEFESAGSSVRLEANSNVASLLIKTAMKDGSIDNIIDQANCFIVELPVTLMVNNNEITIEEPEDYAAIEEIFEENDDDEDTLQINFPVTVILANHTKISVSDADQLEEISDDCAGENEKDEDIECVDIQYPITLSIIINEAPDAVTLQNDKEFFEFINTIDESDDVFIDASQVILILTDGSEIAVNDLDELEEIIEYYMEDCDEDDDYDFDDDDCNDCTVEELKRVLITCEAWEVNKFKREGENLKSHYDDLSFNFQADDIVIVTSNEHVCQGNWSAAGSGNNIKVTITINEYDDLTLEWYLNKMVVTPGVSKVTLRMDKDNELRFKGSCSENVAEEDCNSADCSELESVLRMITNCDGDGWKVSQFRLDGNVETGNYIEFFFVFSENEELIVTDPKGGITYKGDWSVVDNEGQVWLKMNIPIEDLTLSWPITNFVDDNEEKKVTLSLNNENVIVFQIDGCN